MDPGSSTYKDASLGLSGEVCYQHRIAAGVCGWRESRAKMHVGSRHGPMFARKLQAPAIRDQARVYTYAT